MKRTVVITATFILAVGLFVAAIPHVRSSVASDPNASGTSFWPASSAWPRLQCHYSVYVIVAEVARQCQAGRDQEFQAELDRTVARFETVIHESDSQFTLEHLSGFKVMQIGGPEPIKCNGVALKLYEDFHRGGMLHLRRTADKLLTPPKGGWSNAPYCVYDVVPAIQLDHVEPSPR